MPDNVIWVDFRFSKDIRSCQILSFRERMRDHSERTRKHIQSTKSALEVIRAVLNTDETHRS